MPALPNENLKGKAIGTGGGDKGKEAFVMDVEAECDRRYLCKKILD
jgi:hypothetical protein